MRLKERQFRSTDMAIKEEMENVFDEVKTIDASLQQGYLQKKELLKAKDFLNFMDVHSQRSSYACQLRKCSLDTCAYCSSRPVRMPLEESSILSSVFIFPCLMLVDSTLSLSRKCIISYQVKKLDHPWGKQRMMMTMNLTRLIAKFFLQLEESEQQWLVEIVSSPDVCFLKQYWVRRRRTCCVNFKAATHLQLWKYLVSTNFTIPFNYCHQSKSTCILWGLGRCSVLQCNLDQVHTGLFTQWFKTGDTCGR